VFSTLFPFLLSVLRVYKVICIRKETLRAGILPRFSRLTFPTIDIFGRIANDFALLGALASGFRDNVAKIAQLTIEHIAEGLNGLDANSAGLTIHECRDGLKREIDPFLLGKQGLEFGWTIDVAFCRKPFFSVRAMAPYVLAIVSYTGSW
jgi:hypothetical protein